MKSVRFSYNNTILNKNDELYIDEPRRFKSLKRSFVIEDIDSYIKVRYGYIYKHRSEEFARWTALVLDALINSPRFDEEGN